MPNVGNSSIPPRVAASAWGDPLDSGTYSGLPRTVFEPLQTQSRLTGTVSLKPGVFNSLRWGRVDRRSLLRTGPRRWGLAHWRYMPKNIERMSRGLASASIFEGADVAFQFGVGGIPPRDLPLLAHIEYPIDYAVTHSLFARNYGFSQIDERTIEGAMEGERRFVSACDLVWTNTPWMAKLHAEAGFPQDRIRVLTPPGNFPDISPGKRDFGARKILFVGRNWEVKGGDQVVDAFKIVRQSVRDATLVIIGCHPPPGVSGLDGVECLGLLDMNVEGDRARLMHEYQTATVFCMPSRVESTGMVFIEAASCGLPVIMRRIPQTEALYPDDLFPKVDNEDPVVLAELLRHDLEAGESVCSRADRAREHVRREFGPERFRAGIDALIEEAVSSSS